MGRETEGWREKCERGGAEKERRRGEEEWSGEAAWIEKKASGHRVWRGGGEKRGLGCAARRMRHVEWTRHCWTRYYRKR
jgi:hypothetical protein